ncbi:MAG TPA: hypothetical protein VH589_19875 [Trebonia sp.]
MTIALAVAAAVAFGLALGSVMHQVDGATLRRWRLSRRWDVPRLAREFIKAADEPLATVRGLTHMINAWERGARRPSERYWLLYLRVFPECVNGETANGAAKEARPLATISEITAIDAATLSQMGSMELGDVRALAARLRALEQQIAGLTRSLEELSHDGHPEGQQRERRKTGSGYWRWTWTPLLAALASS